MKKLATLLGITGLVVAAACGGQEEAGTDRMNETAPSSELQRMNADSMAVDSMAADTMMEEGMPEEMMDDGTPESGAGSGMTGDGMRGGEAVGR